MGQASFSDQIRRAIEQSGLSRYAICKQIEVDQSTMSRFMHGKGGLSMEALDRLARVLGLAVVTKTESKKER